MKRIADMTPQEAADELVMMELRKLLQKARRAQEKTDEAERAVFQALEDMCIDLDVPTEAENASNLEEAVACYINYGEYSIKGLLSEIRAQYTKDQ